MSDASVSILDGNTFVVSDRAGDIDASPVEPTGLFSFDTRFLSRWILTLNGQRLSPLGVDDLEYFATRFFVVPSSGTIYVNATMSAIRRREVGDGFREVITVFNHDREAVDVVVRLDAASDFADLFEVKDALKKQGTYVTRCNGGTLVLGYQRDTYRRETILSTDPPAEADECGLSYHVTIPRHGQWTTTVSVAASMTLADPGGHDSRARHRPRTGEVQLSRWLEAAPSLSCDDEDLRTTYRRSLVDLAALRFSTQAAPRHSLPAAGLPWFMTLFGRDSIFTSLQALPFVPELAVTTLIALGERQGVNRDDFRDEDPGRILHEQRFGELTAFEERPHSPYYGSADATPLYVVLLDEYERWTGDTALVRSLEGEARAALAWIDDFADLQGNGYVSYERRNKETGLENQCWKDSWDSIAYRDGGLPGFPRATCELQGYAYDAKMRGARLAREIWHDPDFAARLEEDAASLKRRFNRDFWIPSEGYFALALADGGRQVDSLTSNNGHLLWSGIVDRSKARSVVRHLMSDRMFSGWGIRTMAVGEARYNPIGYHVGTVWPFDNSFIAWGLRRYGYRDEAARVAAGILDAATCFGGRLPEAFSGYPRDLTGYPVPYPTACSPQAWSTGAPLLLLRTMLGLEPEGDHLLIDPAIPVQVQQLALLDIRGRWGRIDAFGRGRVSTSQARSRSKSSRADGPGR